MYRTNSAGWNQLSVDTYTPFNTVKSAGKKSVESSLRRIRIIKKKDI